jgi:hypothetical protein
LVHRCRREAVTSSESAQGLSGKVEIAPNYFSHAVYRGLKRGRILAAPTDFPVLQGWLSGEMSVRAPENCLVLTHAGPPILMVTSDTVFRPQGAAIRQSGMTLEHVLGPTTLRPTFTGRLREGDSRRTASLDPPFAVVSAR